MIEHVAHFLVALVIGAVLAVSIMFHGVERLPGNERVDGRAPGGLAAALLILLWLAGFWS